MRHLKRNCCKHNSSTVGFVEINGTDAILLPKYLQLANSSLLSAHLTLEMIKIYLLSLKVIIVGIDPVSFLEERSKQRGCQLARGTFI